MENRSPRPGERHRYLAYTTTALSMLTHCCNPECSLQFANDFMACPSCGHGHGKSVAYSPIQIDESAEGLLEYTSLILAACFFSWAVTLAGLSVYTPFFAGLVASPYLFLWFTCRGLRNAVERVIMGMALLGCCLFGVYAFATVNNHLLGGFNLIFAPLFQLGGSFVSLIFAVIVDQIVANVSSPFMILKGGGEPLPACTERTRKRNREKVAE